MKKSRSNVQPEKTYGDENAGKCIPGLDEDLNAGLGCPLNGHREPTFDNADKGFFEDTSEMIAIPLGALVLSFIAIHTYKFLNQQHHSAQPA
jgi:hypothetical protein